jgi:hypothetical protein
MKRPDNAVRMETATYLDRAAVEPLAPGLLRMFGPEIAEDRLKQMIGHMARQIMEALGFELDRSGLRITRQSMFTTAARYEDGVTYRELLWGLLDRPNLTAKARAEYEAELACPPFPEALAYLWNVFLRLSARRGSGGFGVAPITWPDIDAFVRHSKIEIAPWEIRILEDLDNLYRAAITKPKEQG